MPTDLSDGGRISAVVASTRPTMMPPAKRAEHAAEAAQRHRYIGDQRKRRADVRIDVEEHRHDGAGKADQRRAEAPAQRKHPVLVDADQRHRAGILAGCLQRAAEVSAVDEEIERAEGGDRNQRADQLRHGQEDACHRDRLAAEP